jgi:EAL domain-containing protein (putative c-di-GMP-specific phosphodiesterase class I)
VPEQVLNDADEAMYQAKRAGGARHQLIDLRERNRVDHRDNLERDLRGAAARSELRLDYQPIVRTTDAEITGVEALLRWDHPQLGLISPDTVIPLAEQSDLIVDIGRWVLHRACTDVIRLQAVNPNRPLGICVNVSPHQLMAQGWCDDVQEVLRVTGTNPASLRLEMTESVYVEDSDRAMIVLDELKKLGVGIALDDFGTGYSSLSYLLKFPIDVVKIDRRFIAKLGHQPVSAAIVGAIVNLAHVLDQAVVAEGVETAHQHHQLTSIGCDSCQGFYFARPMPVDELERQLAHR